MNSQYLFVYGTLQSDAINDNAKLFHSQARLLGKARWRGALYLVTNYPAAVVSDDVHENDYVDNDDDDDDDNEAEDDGNGDNDDDDGNDDNKAEDDGNDDNEAEEDDAICVCETLSLMGIQPSSSVPGNTHVAATSDKNLAATRPITTRSSSGGGGPKKGIYKETRGTASRHKKRKTVQSQEDVEVQVPNNSLSTSFVFFIFFVFLLHHSNFILGRGK